MKEGKASRTALTTALIRAIDSIKPADERVGYDPYAKYFVNGVFRILLILAKSRRLRRMMGRYSERRFAGISGFVACRTRYMDDYLKSCIENGIEQLVILGAGYDSRAYRFDQLQEKAKIFEVDYPDTQKIKIDRVRKIFGTLPNHVIYVPIDFNTQKLDERLFESGYDKNLKTLFIWEGVTMFITAEAVDETLAFIVNNSGEGSSIIFDYVPKSTIDGTSDIEAAGKEWRKYEAAGKEWRKYVEKKGEAPTFGIDETNIEEFLNIRGFANVININGKSLEVTYFEGKNEVATVNLGASIVYATVKPRQWNSLVPKGDMARHLP